MKRIKTEIFRLLEGFERHEERTRKEGMEEERKEERKKRGKETNHFISYN
jgi:hypothetical protein